jgi:cobaltochelatase CobS
MLNQVNNDKILAAINALGTNQRTIDSSTRGEVRKLLNGLGYETNQYINLPIGMLEAIYNKLLQGKGEGLAVAGLTEWDMANQRFQAARGMPMPVNVEPVAPATSAPVMAPVAPSKGNASKAAQIAALLAELTENNTVAPLDESRVIELIRQHGKEPLPVEIVITTNGESVTVDTGIHHYILPKVIKRLKSKLNIMLVGPAGSGKTTMAEQAAHAMGVPFYFNGAIDSEYKLTGFMNAAGQIVSTAFRRAYESGGLYLFDEIDASFASALLAFNAALANGHMDFPDGMVKRHKDFYCIAAANTFGKGADRVYVGRNQLDAASLDRFCMLTCDYDEKLEFAISGNDSWTRKVQKIRAAVNTLKIRHVVSPRASINGAKILASGDSEKEALEETVWKGLDMDSVNKIKHACGM